MSEMNGKWALVTGASSGFGIEFASLLAISQGMIHKQVVVITDENVEDKKDGWMLAGEFHYLFRGWIHSREQVLERESAAYGNTKFTINHEALRFYRLQNVDNVRKIPG